MNFEFSDEHDELRATVRAFLQEKSDEAAVRELMAQPHGFAPDTWQQLSEQLGITGLICPEQHGGAGMGYVELLVVMEEMGRALFCAPFLSTAVFAANALLHCATDAAQNALLPELAAGRKRFAVAHAEPGGGWAAAGIAMKADGAGASAKLTGEKHMVLDGCSADLLLVPARNAEGQLALYKVTADAAGLKRTPLPELDLTRKLAHVEFAGTPAECISAGDQSANFTRVLALTVSALAAEQVGGAQRCLDMAVDYAKTRLQFGRPIGSYQGIKHKCADLLVEVEMAKSAAYGACFAAAADAADFEECAAMAAAYCADAYFHAAAENIQIHGGMGFTWEHAAHLYFKRAKAGALLFGDSAYHREIVAQQAGL